MAISITEEPVTPPIPTPVSDCLRWCLQPGNSDVLETPGTFATVEIEFPATPTVPANGTEFTLWGHTFIISTIISSSQVQSRFTITTNGAVTADNFRTMLNANFFFKKTTIEEDAGDSKITLITWIECGEQDNFAGAAMNLTALETAGATVTVTNGATAVLVNGYSLQARLLRANSAKVFVPITKFEGFQPAINCDSAGEVCIDYMGDAKRTLFTPIPDLTLDSFIDPDEITMIGRFKLEFGWTYKDDNCIAQSGAFQQSDEVLVMDTVFDTEENLGMARFIYDDPDKIAPVFPTFLTNKPGYLLLGEYSFAWLWLAAGYDSLYPDIDAVRLRWNVFHKNGTNAIVYVDHDPLLNYQVHCFNVSPRNLLALFSLSDLSTVSHYSIKAEAWDNNPAPLDDIGAETYFAIEESCENLVDVYFKTPPGGIGTILCELTSREIIQEGTEILLDTPCNTSREEKAKYAGRMLNNTRAYERVTLTARRNYNAQEVEYFRSLKASPERWLQVYETGYNTPILAGYVAKRLNIDTGGIRIYQSGEYVDLVITGTTSDIPTQTARANG